MPASWTSPRWVRHHKKTRLRFFFLGGGGFAGYTRVCRFFNGTPQNPGECWTVLKTRVHSVHVHAPVGSFCIQEGNHTNFFHCCHSPIIVQTDQTLTGQPRPARLWCFVTCGAPSVADDDDEEEDEAISRNLDSILDAEHSPKRSPRVPHKQPLTRQVSPTRTHRCQIHNEQNGDQFTNPILLALSMCLRKSTMALFVFDFSTEGASQI